ncbi:MAG: hypothetical protein ACK5RA_12565 [Cyanobacteriota bacterium]
MKRESLSLNAIVSTLNIKAAMFKVTRDQVTHVTVVLNQQNAGFHSKLKENRNGEKISQLLGDSEPLLPPRQANGSSVSHRSSAGWNPAARQEGFVTAHGLLNPFAALASSPNKNGSAPKPWEAYLK